MTKLSVDVTDLSGLIREAQQTLTEVGQSYGRGTSCLWAANNSYISSGIRTTYGEVCKELNRIIRTLQTTNQVLSDLQSDPSGPSGTTGGSHNLKTELKPFTEPRIETDNKNRKVVEGKMDSLLGQSGESLLERLKESQLTASQGGFHDNVASNVTTIQLERLLKEKFTELYNSIKDLPSTEPSESKNFISKYREFLDYDHWMQAGRDVLVSGFASWLSVDEILKHFKTSNGLTFKIFSEKGKIFIKLVDEQISNIDDYVRYKSLLKESLGGTHGMWKKHFVESLVNDGIPIFNEYKNKFMKKSNRFVNSTFSEMSTYLKQIGNKPSIGNVLTSTFRKELEGVVSNFDWRNASKAAKAGKFLGVVGTAFTALDNFTNVFYEDNKLEYSDEKLVKFAVDTSIDILSGAAATATGAAVGSLFAPPVGTVVGAAVGAGVYFATNAEFIGNPPQSLVDYVKDGAHYLISEEFVTDIKETANAVGEALDDLAGKAGDALNDLGGKLSSIFG